MTTQHGVVEVTARFWLFSASSANHTGRGALMRSHKNSAPPDGAIAARSQELFLQDYEKILVRTDRLFVILMVLQWVAAILAAA